MESKTAVWEKRNLGVNTVIFYVNSTDSVQDVLGHLEQCDQEYQEMVISDANTNVLLAVQAKGFRVIEMGIQLSRLVDQEYPSGLYRRFESHISYSYANEDETAYVLSRIKRGDMFLTDKISRDPYFGSLVAGKRYFFWAQDILRNGTDFILAKYKNQTIGFTLCENIGHDTYSGTLGGVFPEYAGKGLGFVPIYVAISALRDKKVKRILSHVSSNNISILKFHEMLGFSVDKMDYVLIKH